MRKTAELAGIFIVVPLILLAPRYSFSQESTITRDHARDWEVADGPAMRFEVASVKEDHSDQGTSANIPMGPGDAFSPTGGLFSGRKIGVYELIDFAYKLARWQSEAAYSQMPKWALGKQYDVEARAKGNPTKDEFRLMVQALLADRFGLALHFETGPVPVFALVLKKPGSLGPNLRPHVDDPPCEKPANPHPVSVGALPTIAGGYPLICGVVLPVRPQTPGFRGGEGGRDVTIAAIASALSVPAWSGLNRPLADETGLTGTFDFFLEWTPQAPPGRGSPETEGKPDFLEAMGEQLGLKPESAIAPLETVVIDHIEEPSPN